MQQRSRYFKHISYAVSLLTLSTLSISCSPEPADTSGSLSTSGTASSISICDNAFVPHLPYSKAEFSENYQLVFVRGGAVFDVLKKFGDDAAEEAAKNAHKIPIEQASEFIGKSGFFEDLGTSARTILQNTEIQSNVHEPLIKYTQKLGQALIIQTANDAMSVINNYPSQSSLQAYLEPQIRQRISSIEVPTDIPGVNETVKSILDAKSTEMARQASLIAISLYCQK